MRAGKLLVGLAGGLFFVFLNSFPPGSADYGAAFERRQEPGQKRAAEQYRPSGSVTAIQKNFHIVSPGFWRSAQPSSRSIHRMKKYGLKTIVNLRQSKRTDRKERNLARELGLNYYHFPLDARREQDPEILQQILNVVEDPARQPVLVHCAQGKDRTGLLAALYKLRNTDLPVEEIRREMLMYGYDEEEFPKLLEVLKKWPRAKKTGTTPFP